VQSWLKANSVNSRRDERLNGWRERRLVILGNRNRVQLVRSWACSRSGISTPRLWRRRLLLLLLRHHNCLVRVQHIHPYR
jgi:hypothetical protein